MDSLLFLIVAGGMVFFLFKFLIFPYFSTKNEYSNYNPKLVVEEISEDRLPKTTQVSANLSSELYKRLNGYCDYKRLSKTYVINEAVAKYLDEIEKNTSNKEDK